MAGKNGDPLTTPKDDAAAKNIRAAMAELATNFATHTDLIPILEAVTAQAVQLISAVDIAGILLIDGERHQALASTAPLAAELGIAQLDLREGPCLDAISNQPLVHCADFARDSRWSRFAAAALTADIHSMMSFHLYSHPKTHGELGGRGALNLFSRKANSFTLADQAVGAMLATPRRNRPYRRQQANPVRLCPGEPRRPRPSQRNLDGTLQSRCRASV